MEESGRAGTMSETPSHSQAVVDLPLAHITISPNRRALISSKAQALAESIREVGLLCPIGVTAHHRLIHGRHRLEAFSLLGRTTIPAIVWDLDDLHAELAELDENLLRVRLTAAQEAKALARRKEVYLALYPETSPHVAGGHAKHGSASDILSFAEDTAKKTGKSRRTVERAVEVGQKIGDAAMTQLVGTAVENNKAALRKIARLPEDDQVKVARLIATGMAKSVDAAIENVGGTREAKTRREREQTDTREAEGDRDSSTTPSPCRAAILTKLTDGQWHKVGDLVDSVGASIPSAVAWEEYSHKTGDSSKPRRALADGKSIIVKACLATLLSSGTVNTRGKMEAREYCLASASPGQSGAISLPDLNGATVDQAPQESPSGDLPSEYDDAETDIRHVILNAWNRCPVSGRPRLAQFIISEGQRLLGEVSHSASMVRSDSVISTPAGM